MASREALFIAVTGLIAVVATIVQYRFGSPMLFPIGYLIGLGIYCGWRFFQLRGR